MKIYFYTIRTKLDILNKIVGAKKKNIYKQITIENTGFVR